MAITKVIADPDDGSTVSEATWAGTGNQDYRKVIRQGKDIRVDPQRDPAISEMNGLGIIAFGQNPNNGAGGGSNSNASSREAWTRYKKDDGFALPTDGRILVTASLRTSRNFWKYTDEGNWCADDAMMTFAQDWTSPLGTQSWLDLEQVRINPNPDCEVFRMMQDRTQTMDVISQGNLQEAGGERLLQTIKARLASGADAQFAHLMWSQATDFPRSRYWAYGFVSSTNGKYPTRFKPHLILRTLKTHILNQVLGASIQLTDGTAVFLRKVGTAINMYYQRINQDTPTLIRKIPTAPADGTVYFKADGEAAQAFSLTRDSSNNVYVVGMDGRDSGVDLRTTRPFLMCGFKYNGNYSWQYYTPTTGGENTLAAHEPARAQPNNFSACWVPSSDNGSAGQLVILFSHRDAQWANVQLGAYSLYAGYLIGSTSSRFSDTEFLPAFSVPSRWRPMNAVGTGLDACAAGGNNVRFTSYVSAPADSDVERSGVGKTAVAGSGQLTVPSVSSATYFDAPHDPDSKARQVWMGDSPTYYGYMRSGQLGIRRMSDDSLFRSIDFTSLGITNFPSKAQLEASQAWDILWDPLRNKFWIYYMDSQNNRNIRKIGYDHINNFLDNSTQLNGAGQPLGASGERIMALRIPRGPIDVRNVLVEYAMVNFLGEAGTFSFIRDQSMNLAPGAVAIDAISAFNSTTAKEVVWTFNDPGDVPSKVAVQIRRVSDSVVVHNVTTASAPEVVSSPKYKYTIPANTLVNDTAYQIRIQAFDAVGAAGTWGDWTAFSTSGTGGTVTITEPSADLLPLNAKSVTVKWTYRNTDAAKIQNGYRIRVYNDATNGLFSDTNIVAGTDTQRTLTGLNSDVRYRIEVQVRDTSGGLSGAAVRYIFPDWDNPPTPIIDVTPFEGYIEVRVTNPAPSGDNPVAISNQIARKESDAADSTYKVIGTCSLNGSFKDYTVASGTDYTYKARSSD